MCSRLLVSLRIATIAIAVALAAVGCTRRPRFEVPATQARRAPLRVQVSTNGTVEPVDDVQVRARLDGRIVEIPEEGGRRVQAGEEIVRFDAAPVTAELAAAESERLAALEALRAARAKAAQVRERAGADTRLYQQNALTRDAYDASQLALRDAEAQLAHQEREVPLRVASLELRIKELTAQRDAAVVRAPVAGTLYHIEAKRDQMVRVGDPLLRLGDLDHLRVRANVDQVDLGRVQPNQRIVVTANAFPGRSWNGVIKELVPHVVFKESRSVAEGLAPLEPPTDGLVPGMVVDVEIIVAEAPNALQVPAQAVLYKDGQPFVYRVDGNRVRATPVQLGLTSVAAAEITSGLADDAVVVTVPPDGLEDDMVVEVRRNDAAPI